MNLRLEALGPATWSTFEALLGGPGFGGCFCAVWTAFDPATWAARCADPARPNLAHTRADLDAGRRPGYLAFEGDAPVAWVGAGPKSAFPLLVDRPGARCTPLVPDVWFVGCLAVHPARRGAGLSRQLVEAVVEVARAAGAVAVEANPVTPWCEARSYRGAVSTWLACGFSEVAREGSALLLRRTL